MKKIIPTLAIVTVTLAALPSCVPVPPPPGPGVGLRVLPYGYRTIHVGSVPYYYYGNRWYRRSHGRYISCPRPRGYHGPIGHPPRLPRPPGLPRPPFPR